MRFLVWMVYYFYEVLVIILLDEGYRMTIALKQTNLFKDAGASVGNFVLDGSMTHYISLSVVEFLHNNTARWFFFILGWM